jgi:nitrite reductase (NADH) small subunit
MNNTEHRIFVASVEELRRAGRILTTVKGMEIGVFAVGEQYYAWRNVCPHAGAPVCEGPICGTRMPSLVYEYKYGKDREILRCPWHGWEFDLLTGEHLVNEKVKLRGYKVEEAEGQLFIVPHR